MGQNLRGEAGDILRAKTEHRDKHKLGKMIRATLRIQDYDWEVEIFLAKTCYHTRAIMQALYNIGISDEQRQRAYSNISEGDLDSGFTYSNYSMGKSVMVTALASSPAEFLDTLVHELRHLTTHIAIARGLPLTGEEVCYLEGHIARALYPACHDELCCRCRKTMGKNSMPRPRTN